MEVTILPIPPGVFWGLVAFAVVAIGVLAVIALPPKALDENSAFRRVKTDLGLTKLNPSLFLVLASIWALLAASLLLGLFSLLWQIILQAAPADQAEVWDYRFSLAKLVALVGTLAAVVAFPFTLVRTHHSRRQTDTEEEGLLTDRINAAVQSLGAQKEVRRHLMNEHGKKFYHKKDGAEDELDYKRPVVETFTEPNIEVRIGAIYALERMAQKNAKEVHVQIMEVLCSYIRENAPASSAIAGPGILTSPGISSTANQDKINKWITDLPPIRSDIQVALAVIGRRDNDLRKVEAQHRNRDGIYVFDRSAPEFIDDINPVIYRERIWEWSETLWSYSGYRPNLSETNLQGVKLSGFDLRGIGFSNSQLQGAEFSGAQLQGVNFNETQMQGANLGGAQIQGASFFKSGLQGVNLGWAHMQGAYLAAAELQNANLHWARMHAADLSDANLQGSDLVWTEMQGADLRRTKMLWANLGWVKIQGANFCGASLQAASLLGARMEGANFAEASMERVNLSGVKMDEETKLTGANLKGAGARSLNATTAEQLRSFWKDIFADGSVVADDPNRPDHWVREELGEKEFHEKWLTWQSGLFPMFPNIRDY